MPIGYERILFSDEKLFDVDEAYNTKNERVWAATREEADAKGGIKCKRKFPQEVMVRLGACSKRVPPLPIFEKDSVGHTRSIRKVLPIAFKYGSRVFGSTSEWYKNKNPGFIDKEH